MIGEGDRDAFSWLIFSIFSFFHLCDLFYCNCCLAFYFHFCCTLSRCAFGRHKRESSRGRGGNRERLGRDGGGEIEQASATEDQKVVSSLPLDRSERRREYGNRRECSRREKEERWKKSKAREKRSSLLLSISIPRFTDSCFSTIPVIWYWYWYWHAWDTVGSRYGSCSALMLRSSRKLRNADYGS